MAGRKFMGDPGSQPAPAEFGAVASMTTMGAVAALPVVLLMFVIPFRFVFPAVAFLGFFGAAIAAAYAWSSSAKPGDPRVSAWDIAGGLALAGCAAAILGDSQDALHFARLIDAGRLP